MGLLLLCLFATGGLAIATTGATMLWRRLRARFGGPATTGEIVQWEEVTVGRHHTHDGEPVPTVRFIAHVRYTAADGQQHVARVAEQHFRDFPKQHPVGAAYPLRADPKRPTVAYPASAADCVFPGLICFAGCLVTLLALGVYFGAPAE